MFTILFVAFLIADNLLRLILSMRQIRYVSRHRNQVPQEFAHHINLKSHQRAADYTIRRTKTSIVERLVDVILLLSLTLFGRLQSIDLYLRRAFDNALMRQLLILLFIILNI